MRTGGSKRARNAQQGTVIIVVAFLWTTLFALAALAVDMGHMYLAKRNLQEAADAAVMAGLPVLATNAATAKTRASDMATKMGYTTTPTTGTGAGGLTTLTVTISTTERFFFAKALGYSTKTLSATSVGQTASNTPALYAGRNTCTTPPSPVVGLQFNGATTITGDIQSNGMANDYGNNTTISGSVTYGAGAACTAAGFGGASKSATGGSLASPYSFTAASFTCTWVAASWSFGGPGPWWASGGPSGHGTLRAGTYCATSGDIDLTGTYIDASTVTLVATNGHVRISATAADISAFDSSNVVAFTGITATDCGNPAINIGNNDVTLTGIFYAPNGCIQSSATTLNVTGSLAGYQVQLSGSSNHVTSSSGGGGGYWLYQ